MRTYAKERPATVTTFAAKTSGMVDSVPATAPDATVSASAAAVGQRAGLRPGGHHRAVSRSLTHVLDLPLGRDDMLGEKHLVDAAERVALQVQAEGRGRVGRDFRAAASASAGSPVMVHSARNSWG